MDRVESVWGTLSVLACALISAPAPAATALPSAPGYQYLLSPPFLGDDAGEPSIAFNPVSHQGLFQSGIHTLRYTLPEFRKDDALNPEGLPESCDTLWSDVSPAGQTTTLDPIGLGDPTTSRYFESQLGVKSSLTNYTDDDGVTWHPSAGGFPGAGGADHQTVGWGPYVAGGLAAPLTAYPNAIYYCSQDSNNVETGIRASGNASGTVGYENCSRSDDGGTTFLPPVTAYTTLDCGGLSGHVRAAPDGTVYVPNKDCTTGQGVAVSEDNGVNWSVRRVPGSTAGTTDPSIGLASDGTGYLCYSNGDGHAHAAVTHDKGQTWVNDTDLGAQVGVVIAVFPEAIAGDADRAACGFLGTSTPGNSDAEDFPGIWFPYISVTYDGGKTWTTTNVSPGDPAQGVGGICTQAQACGTNRNLLDFNDMTIDSRGRPLMGFADGCTGPCVLNPQAVDRTSKAAIGRMVGGKSLYARLDRPEPLSPEAACLGGGRDSSGSWLTWRKPAFEGSSQVTNYRIYRGTTASAAGDLIATTDARTAYSDFAADPGVPDYYYTVVALNAAGASVHSNLIHLPLGGGTLPETACIAPGLTILDDAQGDAGDNMTAHDLVKLSVSQPAKGNGDYKLYFNLKVASLSSMPATTAWSVNFCSPAFPCVNPDANTQPYGADNQYYTVEMSTVPPASAAAPVFQIYQPGAGVTTAAGRSVVPALGESTFTADGLITIVVNASDLGLQAGGAGTDRLSKFQAQATVRGSVGGPISVTSDVVEDTAPDDSVGKGEFATLALDACAPNMPPTPVLGVDRDAGAPPLTVNFDASASGDAEDAITSYTFDFGDGSEAVTQAGASITHVYESAGSYTASLTVTDARGLVSPVPATHLIHPGIEPEPQLKNNWLGGTGELPVSGLLLGLIGALARRVGRRKT